MPKPEGYDLYRWFDLGPMRPDDYHRQCALDWNEAVTLRNAIYEGEQHAKDDEKAQQQISRMTGGGAGR